MMTFMQPEMTNRQLWIEIDGNMGTEWVDCSLLGTLPEYEEFDDDDAYSDALFALCRDYVENSSYHRLELVEGFGVRLSAPGYMDCTEMCVFPTEIEALEYLLEQAEGDEECDWREEIEERLRLLR